MGVKVTRFPDSTGVENTEYPDPTGYKETTVDGYTFNWGPNETRNFLDEGVGAAHAAFYGGATIVQEDPRTGNARF